MGDELLGLLDEPDDLMARARSVCVQLAEREQVLLVEAGRCEQLERRAAAALADGQQRERDRLRKSELIRRQLALAEQEPEIAGQRRQLNDSVRAERVRPSLEALQRSEQRQTAAEARLADQRAVLDERHRVAEPEAWRVAARDLRDVVAALAPQRGVELELQNARQAVAALEEDATSMQTEIDRLRVALRALPQRIAATRPQREQALMAMAGLQTAKQDEKAARQRVEASVRAVALSDELGAARASLARATVDARRAHDREHDLRTRYLDGAAAALAVELVTDAPCPVCGSVAHPRPARVTADAVDRTQVEVAEAARRDAMAARDAAERRVSGLEVEYAILESLTGGQSKAAADQRLQTAVAAVAVCAAATTRLAEVDALLSDLTGEEQKLTQRLATLQLRHQAARLAVTAAQQEAARLRTLLADARGDYPSVAERLAVESECARRLEAADEAAVAARAAADERRRCAAELAHRSTREGFDDVSAVEKALLSEPERLELGRVVGAHDVERAELTGALADPALVGIDVGQATDTVSLEEAARQAVRGRQSSTQAAAAARQLLEGARAGFDDVVSAVETRAADWAATAPVVRMANLIAASGSDNSRGMTLATFVLIERFRDVVAAANERLSDMSEGRYALVHAEDRAGQRKAGLGLSVLDAQTGQARDPRTLSGGETFYCSLALALGLADVVTSEAGGISLGTLFVDEGFGALDPETLEQVLAVLDRLRAGGRVVGVVSHVPELKERISERVVVTRNRDGSSRIRVVS
jgi:exonuclease SbcC